MYENKLRHSMIAQHILRWGLSMVIEHLNVDQISSNHKSYLEYCYVPNYPKYNMIIFQIIQKSIFSQKSNMLENLTHFLIFDIFPKSFEAILIKTNILKRIL